MDYPDAFFFKQETMISALLDEFTVDLLDEFTVDLLLSFFSLKL